MGMGFGLGGGNSKQTTNNSTEITDYTNTNSVGDVMGGFQPVTVNGGNGNTITTTDFRAIEAGTSLAQQALDSGASTFETFANKLGAQSDSIVNKSLGIAAKSQTSEGAQMQDTLIKVALIGAVGFGLYAFAKGRA